MLTAKVEFPLIPLPGTSMLNNLTSPVEERFFWHRGTRKSYRQNYSTQQNSYQFRPQRIKPPSIIFSLICILLCIDSHQQIVGE